MKNAMKNILAACIVTILLISCKKSVSELPPATETGANTFGAKVDGNFWVPSGFGPINANSVLRAHFAIDNGLYIEAKNLASSPKESEFLIFIKGVDAPGTYLLNMHSAGYPNQSVSYAYYVKRNITPENEWRTSDQYTGSVTVTKLDKVSKIVSGTFQFNAINLYNTPVTLTVTEGRFDIKYE